MKKNIPTRRRIARAAFVRPAAFALATAISLASAVSLSSCASVKFEDKSVEWVARFDEKSNEFELRPIDGTRAAIIGEALAAREGDVTVTVDRIRWFNNWRDGWTEAEIPAEGTFVLRPDEAAPTGYRVLSVSPIELYDAAKARIRYRGNLLLTADATTLFNRRLGRIRASAVRLAARGTDASTFRAFSKDAGGWFFPEVYGYPEGTSKSEQTKENRTRAEGYSWDTAYTRDRMPEELREIRDTGTLFRDWEENAELFYFIYTLEKLK
jgi:hypothetical protein